MKYPLIILALFMYCSSAFSQTIVGASAEEVRNALGMNGRKTSALELEYNKRKEQIEKQTDACTYCHPKGHTVHAIDAKPTPCEQSMRDKYKQLMGELDRWYAARSREESEKADREYRARKAAEQESYSSGKGFFSDKYAKAGDAFREAAQKTKCPGRRKYFLKMAEYTDCLENLMQGGGGCTMPEMELPDCPEDGGEFDEEEGSYGMSGNKMKRSDEEEEEPYQSAAQREKQRQWSASANALQSQANSIRNLNRQISEALGTEYKPDAVSDALANQLERLGSLSKSRASESGTNAFDPTSGLLATAAATDLTTSLINGGFTVLGIISDNKRRKEEEKRIREEEEREEQRQEMAYQRQVQLAKDQEEAKKRAVEQAYLSQFNAYFNSSRIPSDDFPLREVYYVPTRISNSMIEVGAAPIKVTKTLFDTWPELALINQFVTGSSGASGSAGIITSGFYTDRMSAENAITEIMRLVPNTGYSVQVTKFNYDEKELNQHLSDLAIEQKKKQEMEARNAMIHSLRNSLPPYKYPTSILEEKAVSFILVFYTNDMSGVSFGLSNIITVPKHSDGTWPLKPDFEKKLHQKINNTTFEKYFTVGYTTVEEMKNIEEALKKIFTENKLPFEPLNIDMTTAPATKINSDFWKK